jgi:hypothetical protein
MKTLLILIAIIAGFTTAYAQFNTPIPSGANFSATVITPFNVWDVTPNGSPALPDIIKGQTRTWAEPGQPVQLFQMKKEANYVVYLDMECPSPAANGLVFTGHWYFFDAPPDDPNDFNGYPLSQDFLWSGTQTDGWITLHVTGLDATNCSTTGTATFTATVRGQYTGI